MIRYFFCIALLASLVLTVGCSHEKTPLPVIPSDDDNGNIGRAVYVQINPPLDAANGYNFNHPSDIYLGADNFLYVCDTGNNRIVMMDVGGAIQGISQPIPHPEAVTQNDSLQLLIVNNTNAVFKIDLFAANHQIGQAPVEKVFEQTSRPTRKFTGISVYNGFEYYVTVIDTADSSTVFKEFSFIYDFNADHTLKGPLPMNVNGTGLFSAIVPTAIVSIRERWLDISSTAEKSPEFYFTHIGRTSQLPPNNFKLQHITTAIREGDVVLVPNTGLIGQDIYSFDNRANLSDVALDRSGFVFVVDAGGSGTLPGFYRFSQQGTLLQSVVGEGNGEKEFRNPSGIAVLPFLEQQIVFVSDTENNRILRFKLSTDL
jgi:hypothetical protein